MIATMLLCAVMTADPNVFYHENVLGTSLELRVLAVSPEIATQAETAALAEIDRLAAIFSTYDPDSELSRWHRRDAPTELSPELCDVLRACDHWRTVTGGAFHPGTEVFTQLWQAAERADRLPTVDEFQLARSQLARPPWEWVNETAARSNDGYPISLNAIAKGSIIEQACRRMQSVDGVTGALVKIGGDLRVMGDLTMRVDINPPTASLLTNALIDCIRLHNRALATSSGAFRGVKIDGRRYSHLIDPRTGQPVDHVHSATVVAPHAADADALATACSVLTVSESLALVDSLDHTACLLLDRTGRVHRSRDWPIDSQVLLQDHSKPVAWNGGMELEVRFEINQPDAGGRYRRPYVVVWVEDAEGKPVRTLVLWVQTSGPGPKWIPDLKRWYRSERNRKQAQGTDLIGTISEATRKPGQYTVVWNGLNEVGELVPPGDYTILIEAAREHGTYQLIRKTISCRDEPAKATLEGNVEIKSATLEYRKTPLAKRS